MYLLHKNDKGQKNRFTFKDFFHFDSVELEHPHLDVISFEEFLKREAMTGHLIDPQTGKPSFPPNNQTNWDGQGINYEAGKKGVFPWLRKVTKRVDWDWDSCLASFPSKAGPEGVRELEEAWKEAEAKIQNAGPVPDQQAGAAPADLAGAETAAPSAHQRLGYEIQRFNRNRPPRL